MTATRYELFIGVTPGLEELLTAELESILDQAKGVASAGGVTLRCQPLDLWTIAHRSRLAESLRVRLGRFEAREFGDLKKRITRLPLNVYLPRDHQLELRVTTKRSRLYHSDAVAERATAALEERLATPDAPARDARPVCASKVHLRLLRDEVTVSVDAVGAQRLHQRGYRKNIGRAPLRETLAAACLRAADLPAGRGLWDPFCGSGTLAIEHLAGVSGLPASGARDFAFSAWPTHDAEAYAAYVASLPAAPRGSARAHASDLVVRELNAARPNAEAAGVTDALDFHLGDFAAVAPTVLDRAGNQPLAIVSNLPYGKRSKGGGPDGLEDSLRRFGELLKKQRRLDPVCVLFPTRRRLERLTGCRWHRLLSFDNRGLKVGLFRLNR